MSDNDGKPKNKKNVIVEPDDPAKTAAFDEVEKHRFATDPLTQQLWHYGKANQQQATEEQKRQPNVDLLAISKALGDEHYKGLDCWGTLAVHVFYSEALGQGQFISQVVPNPETLEKIYLMYGRTKVHHMFTHALANLNAMMNNSFGMRVPTRRSGMPST